MAGLKSIGRELLSQGIILAALALVLSGCAPTYSDHATFIVRPTPIVGGRPYVIEPPDTIRVIAPNAVEIDNKGGAVRPDGFVTFPLLGDVFVAGKTPTQLAAEIQTRVLRYYEDVNVQVEVTGFHSKKYYMAGETSVGPRPYTGKDRILDAVLTAGLPRTSWPEYCTVLRPNEEQELIRRMTINLKDMYEKGDLKYNAMLEEGDIIYIPINPLASVGVVIQNLLAPVGPIISAASTPYQFQNIGTDPNNVRR